MSFIETESYKITPMATMASKLGIAPNTYYNECYKEGSPIQAAHLKGETKRLDYEINYIQTLYRCNFTGEDFVYKVGDNLSRQIKVTDKKLAFQIKAFDDFLRRFNHYSLTQAIHLRLYGGSNAPFSKERDLKDLRYQIISKLDEELGKKTPPQDSSFNVERLKLLGREVSSGSKKGT